MAEEIEEVLVRPLGEVLAKVAEGVAQAQRTMDLAAIATQTLIDNDPVLSGYGLRATWYPPARGHAGAEAVACPAARNEEGRHGEVLEPRLSLLAAPHNARVQNTLGLAVAGTSSVRARIVSIPPPRPAG